MELKTTPFTDEHISLGAKMAEFAGYYMPIQYTSIIEEHNNVRNNVGVFDVSHMGEFRAKGPHAKHFMQYVTVNDIDALSDGKVQYTCLPNGKGGIVDDMLVYRVHDDEYFMVPNAANIDKDWAWMSQIADKMGLTPGVDFVNESEQWAQLAVQGPNALKAMQKLTDSKIEDMEYYTFQILTFAGVKNVILSTTGYTGAGGCEIYIPVAEAKKIWKAVFEAGKEFGIMPAGLGCRDTLRLEKGFCLYGHEMDDTISPLEAPLAWITKLKADNNAFLNKELFLAQKAVGVKRKISGFEMVDHGIARNGYEVFDAEGNKIGEVCSGSMSPSTGKNIGTALLKADFAKADTEIFVQCGKRMLKAVTVKMPFYDK
ncbi:MAG: glycine cleavage system aminomethyltransferase GcvT [Bacteroidales bacterium]|nr:glycine cleavage system aminomethyltransferase GcvT [Bacteroidales bacterium]